MIARAGIERAGKTKAVAIKFQAADSPLSWRAAVFTAPAAALQETRLFHPAGFRFWLHSKLSRRG